MSLSITKWMQRNTRLGKIASKQSTTDLTLLTLHRHYIVFDVICSLDVTVLYRSLPVGLCKLIVCINSSVSACHAM